MRIRDLYNIRQLSHNTYVIEITEGKDENYNKIVTFNSTAVHLWDTFREKEFSLEDIANYMVSRYNINKEIAMKDATKMVRKWIEADLVESAIINN